MLKCHLDSKTNTCEIKIEGRITSILADLSYLINDIYLACRNENPLLGEAFRFSLQRMVGDDSSPIWQELGAHESTNEVREDGVKRVSIRFPGGLFGGFMRGKHGE